MTRRLILAGVFGTDFLLARIAEDEAPTFELVPYRCPPGHCAPAGWVGHRCLICDDGTIYGGTVKAITESAREHEERFHRRTRVLAECEAKRAVVGLLSADIQDRRNALRRSWAAEILIALALPYADHPDYPEEWGAA